MINGNPVICDGASLSLSLSLFLPLLVLVPSGVASVVPTRLNSTMQPRPVVVHRRSRGDRLEYSRRRQRRKPYLLRFRLLLEVGLALLGARQTMTSFGSLAEGLSATQHKLPGVHHSKKLVDSSRRVNLGSSAVVNVIIYIKKGNSRATTSTSFYFFEFVLLLSSVQIETSSL